MNNAQVNLQQLPQALQDRHAFLSNAPVRCKGGEEINAQRKREIAWIEDLGAGEVDPIHIPVTNATHCRVEVCGRKFEDSELVLRASDLDDEEDVYGLCCVENPQEIELFWAIAPTDELARAERTAISFVNAVNKFREALGDIQKVLGATVGVVQVEMVPKPDGRFYLDHVEGFDESVFSQTKADSIVRILQENNFIKLQDSRMGQGIGFAKYGWGLVQFQMIYKNEGDKSDEQR